MELFDIINSFTNEEEWKKVTNAEKSRNLFMINRILSIKYPLQAQAFNLTKIDPIQTVNWWKEMIGKNYTKPPGFIYTPTGKKEKKILKKPIPPEVYEFLRERFEVCNRDLDYLLEFYPLEFQKYCQSIKEMIS